MMNRIDKRFRELKRNNKKAFIAFITAGYPDLTATKRLVLELAKRGVDIIELGVPFSDPLADGPVIQESSQAALRRGVNIDAILNLIKQIRQEVQTPVALMTYYNPIFCYGEERFAKRASTAGVDGVIIPDLPPEEGANFIRVSRKFNLDTIFFLSPTSTRERIRFVAKLSRGFVYYVSLTGVTGPRESVPSDLTTNLRLIKKYTNKPICVGFGISSRKQVKEICKVADGVIIGSAVIKKIKENIDNPDLVKKVGGFVFELMRH